MSEENVQETNATTETPVEETVETKKTLDQLSQEELVDYVKTLRKENASHRTAKQAKDKELEEFRAWKDSQKTELERFQEKAEKLEKENLSLLRTSIALSYGLDQDDIDFVRGDTPDEMKASAEKLASRLKATEKKPSVTDVFAGNRGTPVSEGPKDPKAMADAYMRMLVFGQ